MKTRKAGIKTRILLPLALAILVLLGISMITIHRLQGQHIDKEVRSRLAGVQRLFQEELEKDAELLHGMIDFLVEDKNLQDAWIAKDRDTLLSHAAPLFKEIRSKYRVTHFYFHGLDRVCFLRAHKPPHHGDYVNRFTLGEAESKGKPSHGIELGKYGTFTLRAVHPWRIAGELVGYMELGMEIEHITPKLKEVLGAELFFVIQKSHINRVDWETGLQMLGRTGDWDQFPEFALIDRTMEEIPAKLGENIKTFHAEHQDLLFTEIEGDRKYRGGFVPLIDVVGNEVGDIIVLKDVTKVEASLRRLSATMIGICAVIGTLLFGFSYLYASRIEQSLTKAYGNLTVEMQDRKQAEKELREHREHLEELVQQGTVQLREANEQLRAEIDERKRAEQQALTANERLQYLLSSTSVVIYTSKVSGDYGATFVSRSVAELVGYKPEEFVADSSFWLNHVHPDDVQRVQGELPRMFQQERYEHEYRFRCKDGRYIWIRDELRVARDETGQPLEIVGYWIDITERKRGEQDLAQKLQELERANTRLERFNRLGVGREQRMIELKRQINEMAQDRGKAPPYDLSFVGQDK